MVYLEIEAVLQIVSRLCRQLVVDVKLLQDPGFHVSKRSRRAVGLASPMVVLGPENAEDPNSLAGSR